MAQSFSLEEALAAPQPAAPKATAAFSLEEALEPTPTTAPAQGGSSLLRQTTDAPVSFAKGAVQGVRMIADAFGADSKASKAIRGVEDYLGGLMSAQAKNDQQAIARIMKEAEDKGVVEQVRAGLRAFSQAPVDLLTQGLGTAAPVVLGTLGSQILGAGALAARGIGLLAGTSMGAGTVKGTIYEETKKALKGAGVPEADAEARAKLAQSYGGQNLDLILTGAALGGLGAVSGVEKPIADMLTRRILSKAAAQEAATQAPKSLAKRVVTTAATETVPEMAQAGQGKIAENVAQQREGLDVPTMRGVVGAATLEGAVGAGMGAGVGALSGRRRGAATPSTQEKAAAETFTLDDAIGRTTGTVEEYAAKLEAQGFPSEEARRMAEVRLGVIDGETENQRELRLEREAIQAENTPPTGLQDTAPTLETVTEELVGQGYSEEEARVLAELYVQRQGDQVATDQGGPSATKPDTAPDRGGAAIPTQPTLDLAPAATAEGVERAGVVPAGSDVGAAPAGEGKQPVAVTQESITTTTTGETVGPETAEAVQAETQGQEPAAPAATEVELDAQLAQRKAAREEARSFARSAVDTAVGSQNDYPGGLAEAVDANRENVVDTLNERDAEQDVIDAAIEAYDQEAAKLQQEQAPAAIKTVAPAVEGEAPKKRGRPAVLTDEERAQRATEVKADRKQREKHRRALAKLIPDLKKATTPIDEGEFESDDALKDAQNDQRSERRAAVRELVFISEESGLKPAGKQARAALKEAGIPDAEIADIKRGLAVTRKLASENNLRGPAASKGASATKADPALSAAKTGAQAIAHIIRTSSPILRLLAQRIRNFVPDVKIVVLEKGDPVPAQLQTERNAKHWERSRALFIENFATGERVIYARGASFGNAQGVNNVTMLHELWHAATVKKIALAQMFIDKGVNLSSPLVKAYNDLLATMRSAQERFIELNDEGLIPAEVADLVDSTDFSIIADPREFVAYGMTDREFQEFLMQAEGQVDKPNLFTRFVNSLRSMFGMPPGSVNALSDLLSAADSLLTSRIPGKVNIEGDSLSEQVTPPKKDKTQRTRLELEADVREAIEKVDVSRLGTEQLGLGVKMMQAARDPKKALELLKSLWSGASYAQRQFMVKLPTMDVLAQWASDSGIPRIAEVQKHLQEMNGMSLKFLEGANQVVQAARNVFAADPGEKSQVEDLVYATTLAEYDPSLPGTVRNKALDDNFNSLSVPAKKLYVLLREYYENVNGLFRLLLDKQVEDLENVSADVKRNLMVMLRQTFEQGGTIQPFFPLVRRGDFWASAVEGKERKFYLFESRAERNAFAKNLKGDVKTGNGVSSLRLATKDSSNLLKAFFDAVDSQDMTDPTVRDGLKDAVYQIYLQTMPEQSFRKMFIHRKGVAGFSTDLVRNTATTASRMATQLARLKYAPVLRNDMAAARSAIEGREELTPFVEETERRINSALSGQPGGISEAVAGAANKVSYIWYMTSAASALIQPFSVLISGLPVLAANHGGNWAGAAREIGKMMTHLNQYGITRKNIDGSLSYTSPSIANNNSLSQDERTAVKAMMERGVQESTYASQVWGYSRTPSADIDSVVGKGKRAADVLVGGLMHTTERMTREIVYLASYRLGKKRGLSTEEAIDQAVADTNEALSDYDVSNRPRWMQRGLGKIAFQFKMYPLHMTLLALTSFKKMLPFLNKEGKAAAAQKFFGLMGTSAMLAGTSNMLFFSPIMALLGWAWKQMDDEDDLPEELKDKSFETWFRTVFLPEKLGDIKLGDTSLADLVDRGPLNAMTGLDIGSRIGLNDLWGRDAKETKSARDSAVGWVVDNFGGPTVSLGLNMVDAYESYMLGDYQKAIEKTTPALIRNVVIANKYADEGVKTARGAELVPKEALTDGEVYGQAIGFRPDRAAAAQAQAFKLTGIEQKVLNQRDFILRKLNVMHKKEDDDGFETVIDKDVQEFNRKNPEYAIESEDIYNSIKKQAEQRASARAGVTITEKNSRLMQDALDNVEKTLEKPTPKK